MLEYACSDIAAITGGRLIGRDTRVTGVSFIEQIGHLPFGSYEITDGCIVQV